MGGEEGRGMQTKISLFENVGHKGTKNKERLVGGEEREEVGRGSAGTRTYPDACIASYMS